MRMGIEAMNRRRFCGLAAALAGWPAAGWTAARPVLLAGAWDQADGHRVGVLRAGASAIVPQASVQVPTRAHEVLIESPGRLIAVARRPGDWLLRWRPGRGEPDWVWAEPGRAFSGHALLSADRRRLFTTETDLDNGAGLIGVRDAATLEKQAEWLTHGIDSHELMLDGGTLLVANGGVLTQPETGRLKRDLDRMDSSLVRLDLADGALRGQWRLADRRLSLRHLARHGARIGIALQAEHDNAAVRETAPVLAVFDGARLRAAPSPIALNGYGGDIAATEQGFAVSCPRANRVAHFAADGGWQHGFELAEACALAVDVHDKLWMGGMPQAADQQIGAKAHRYVAAPLRLDNHWVRWVK
jgi:hypothetical protein